MMLLLIERMSGDEEMQLPGIVVCNGAPYQTSRDLPIAIWAPHTDTRTELRHSERHMRRKKIWGVCGVKPCVG